MQKNHIIIVAILMVGVGVGGFLLGRTTATSSQSARYGQYTANMAGGQRNGSSTQTPNRGGMMRFRPVTGDIMESSDDSITVKLMDGSSKIILFSAKTDINKAQKAMASDLKVGEKVLVTGQENPDGSITAQNIQLNPVFRGQIGTSPTKNLMK